MRRRHTSPLSIGLAIGGVLVGLASIAVVLRSRTSAPAGRAAETGSAPAATAAPVPATPRPPAEVVTPAATASRAAAPPPPPAAAKEPDKISAADRQAVENAILAYASALDAGSLDEARGAFPAVSEAQVGYLDSLFTSGGRIRTIWRVTDIALQGERATARVRGATRTEAADGTPSDRAMDSRVVLERRTDGWRIRSMTGPGMR